MSKICKNIICGERYFFISEKGELICKTSGNAEQILERCIDFDAVLDEDGIHIAAAANEGNTVYIRCVKNRWGMGIVSSGIRAENIFIYAEKGGMIMFFVSGEKLFLQKVDSEIHQAELIDEISLSAAPFAVGNTVFYVNKLGNLCQSGAGEICQGKDINHIFATENEICFKDGDKLLLLARADLLNQQLLTRRHGKNACCPVLAETKDGKILCWCDGEKVFAAKRAEEKWQRLESFVPPNADLLGIFKFDGVYDLGCMIEGEPCSLNVKKSSNKPD